MSNGSNGEDRAIREAISFGRDMVLRSKVVTKLALALKLQLSREIPNHDPDTCTEPSCVLAREALAEYEIEKQIGLEL